MGQMVRCGWVLACGSSHRRKEQRTCDICTWPWLHKLTTDLNVYNLPCPLTVWSTCTPGTAPSKIQAHFSCLWLSPRSHAVFLLLFSAEFSFLPVSHPSALLVHSTTEICWLFSGLLCPQGSSAGPGALGLARWAGTNICFWRLPLGLREGGSRIEKTRGKSQPKSWAKRLQAKKLRRKWLQSGSESQLGKEASSGSSSMNKAGVVRAVWHWPWAA